MYNYNDGIAELLVYYANVYKKDGRLFVNCFVKFKSVRSVCREIVRVYKKELVLDPKCVEYGNKLNQEQLGEILSLIKYVLT